MKSYADIETKWRSYWEQNDIYKTEVDHDRPKYYVLDMFPYPSGAGLHVGHPLGYIASDIFSRYKRMKGFNVLHPMGFDAFGLPAEEYALQTGIHPAISTEKNMQRYREQMASLGFSYDWSREVRTCDPAYYKWTQWIFTRLFAHYYDLEKDQARPIEELIRTFARGGNMSVKAATTQLDLFSADQWNSLDAGEQEEILMNYRLAYRKVGFVNWCEELGTVLANDQVKDGVSERGGFPVIQKAMTQWYLRITAYAERLLKGLDQIDWSSSLKTIQTNWIGKSTGARVFFDIAGSDEKIEVFTTRADTIFGATYMVLAPNHDLVDLLTTDEQRETVTEYKKYVNAKSEIERMAEKEVTGVFIGAYAINPFTEKEIPIWIGEYVLKDYGTGAIMAVPSDDERDQAFAQKFGLKIIDVVDKSDYPGAGLHDKLGKLINSDFLNGLEVLDAIDLITSRIEEMGIGRAETNYKMRDANFSRQRYWGEPFPIKYTAEGKAIPLEINELPLVLPDTDDFQPGKGGKPPLSRIEDWVNMEQGFTRETDVMPAVAGSSWYFLRYMDPHNTDAFVGQEEVNYWESVDLYIGGSEHAVAHLMYARFWHKFLFDLGLVPTREPFKKLINQGMIQGVIEFIFLDKTSASDGVKTFVSAELAADRPAGDFARIPVHIDFVSQYGSTESHLTEEGIQKFIEWRPEYKNARFECSHGYFQGGKSISEPGEEIKMITDSEVGKMSKSKFNVINPEEVTERYGTDCFRMYEMFLGPIEQAKPWDTNGIDGVSKFLRRFTDIFYDGEGSLSLSVDEPTAEELRILHATIKKVSQDIENFSFNTAISAMMVCVNELRKLNCNKRDILEPLIRLIAPFAPFTSEELWHQSGHNGSVHLADYPGFNEAFLVQDTESYPVCINGKKRGMEEVAKDTPREEIEKMVLELDFVKKWTEGKSVQKVIVVPGRMINIVVR